jgi:hypothetical protein
VNAVELNGHSLAFTVEANPHRRGAALIDWAVFREHLSKSLNHLSIKVG